MLLLDANVVIDLLRRRTPALRGRFDELRAAGADIALSAIVLFELRFGVANSDRPEQNGRLLDAFLDSVRVVPFDAAAAERAGAIRATLGKAGRSIGPYDVLIAGHALALGATLVTSNRGEFDRVPGLVVSDWAR